MFKVGDRVVVVPHDTLWPVLIGKEGRIVGIAGYNRFMVDFFDGGSWVFKPEQLELI